MTIGVKGSNSLLWAVTILIIAVLILTGFVIYLASSNDISAVEAAIYVSAINSSGALGAVCVQVLAR